MKTNVLLAVLKRNFFSYFSSPIGYVFICAFVLLTAVAAFWPHAFFNSNLANLDQLNLFMPRILLVFVPAITMSIWSDERRQGTDELLLTLPAGDFEIVLGKYLAAALVYTVALIFSLSNVFVLIGLGSPDIGLLIANFIGYWVVGSAMIAVGMVASFLTRNLTVGFILAIIFNAPLVFAAASDAILPGVALPRLAASLSIADRFADFGRGVLSLRNLIYFGAIASICVYLAMVLIGRRHWSGRQAGLPFWCHYAIRTVGMVAIAIGLVIMATRFDARLDLTAARLGSLSAGTKPLLAAAGAERPVIIEAYVSPEVPEEYVQTRLDLLSMLREVDARAGNRIIVRVNETERYSDRAAEAREQFGILPRQVPTQTGGRFAVEEIFLGLAVMSGLDQVVIPFIDRGLSPEYEMVRSIATVSDEQRLRVGVLATDAQLFGGFDMQSFSQRPDQPIIGELRKQYDVVPVNATSPVPEDIDVLLAVQPSSLPPQPLANFLSAVARGLPTAIFEDPFPFFALNSVPATSQPRQAQNPNPFQQQQQPPEPKGDIRPLWSLIHLTVDSTQIVWDAYNPYPRLSRSTVPPEFVFIGPESGTANAFNDDNRMTSGLQEMLLAFPGSIAPLDNDITFEPLLRAGSESGAVAFEEILQMGMFGPTGLNMNRRHRVGDPGAILAAAIRGEPNTMLLPPSDDTAPSGQLNVVFVADIDCLYPVFFSMREQGAEAGGLDMNFDNVTFVLNVLDTLAGDDRFIDVRKRRPRHRTLTAVEARTETARVAADAQRDQFLADFELSQQAETDALQAKVDELNARDDMDLQAKLQQVALVQQNGQRRLEATIERLERERDEATATVERDLAQAVRRVQTKYKLAAVVLPPILPLILAVIVFVRRRRLESIGVPSTRRR